MTDQTKLIDKRIDKGVAKLDDKLGKQWVHAIDLDTLYLGSSDHCVIGQLAPETDTIRYFHGRAWDLIGVRAHQALVGMGFAAGSARYDYDQLTARWVRRIRKLKWSRRRSA